MGHSNRGDQEETNSSVVRKIRRKLTSCSFCPPHDHENRTRRPRPDVYKEKKIKKIFDKRSGM